MILLILRRFWIPILTIVTPIFWCWVFTLDGSHQHGPPSHAMRCLYVLAIMATYWMTSVYPLAITSLIPVALFPLLGILSTVIFPLLYNICTNYFYTLHTNLNMGTVCLLFNSVIYFFVENGCYAIFKQCNNDVSGRVDFGDWR